jgi:hypothetical protein
MPDAKDTRYGAARFTQVPYAAYSNPAGVASEDQLGVPFLLGNDRYQVVVCADSGTSASAPAWRYWYGGAVPWGEHIAQDSNFPVFHTVDEDEVAVMADLELGFRQTKAASEVLVDGLYVEFTPQPQSVSPLTEDAEAGFSVRVEGYGLPDYANTIGTMTTGVIVSDVTTVTLDLADQPNDPWPNTRTVHVPIRFSSHVRAFRPIFSDLYLVEVNRVTVLGKQLPLSRP